MKRKIILFDRLNKISLTQFFSITLLIILKFYISAIFINEKWNDEILYLNLSKSNFQLENLNYKVSFFFQVYLKLFKEYFKYINTIIFLVSIFYIYLNLLKFGKIFSILFLVIVLLEPYSTKFLAMNLYSTLIYSFSLLSFYFFLFEKKFLVGTVFLTLIFSILKFPLFIIVAICLVGYFSQRFRIKDNYVKLSIILTLIFFELLFAKMLSNPYKSSFLSWVFFQNNSIAVKEILNSKNLDPDNYILKMYDNNYYLECEEIENINSKSNCKLNVKKNYLKNFIFSEKYFNVLKIRLKYYLFFHHPEGSKDQLKNTYTNIYWYFLIISCFFIFMKKQINKKYIFFNTWPFLIYFCIFSFLIIFFHYSYRYKSYAIFFIIILFIYLVTKDKKLNKYFLSK